jgi:ankyrin repeat protein
MGPNNTKVARALLRLPGINVNLNADANEGSVWSVFFAKSFPAYGTWNINYDLLQALIESGLAVNPLTKREANSPSSDSVQRDDTPLIIAIQFRQPRLVNVLIQAGADVNKRANGHTPLTVLFWHQGYEPEKLEMMCLLVDAGADVNASYPDTGATVLDFVRLYQYKINFESILRDLGARTSKELQQSAQKKASAAQRRK